MKYTFLFLLALFISFSTVSAQTTETRKEAAPADVATIDGITKAVYDVISGDAGKPRDWDRFRSLFHKDGRLIPTGKNQQTGVSGARVMSADDYIKGNSPFFEKNGFHEREIVRKVDQYGNIAQVFSSYEAFSTKEDKEPFMRGINSFQLHYDGKRWWVMNIFWLAETPDNPLPAVFSKPRK